MSLDFNGAWDHGLIVDSGYYDEDEEDCDPGYHQHWVDQLKEAARKLGEASRAGNVPVETTQATVVPVKGLW